MKNLIIQIVIFVKYKTILDIFNPINYRGSQYQYNSSIILSVGGKTIHNNNNNLHYSNIYYLPLF